ncbi:LytR/AlgR family response regulator transcription factor [Aquimarina pacifica]|uniref:LytR/AlgR family response regulator transcription factor n=1 Tax=Aquimarina pacifica TaxID=1296415 RepID=UPI0004720898|nr:response regulator transcription factor [Aquimarina pacifica]
MKNLTAIIIEENMAEARLIKNVVEKQCSGITITTVGTNPREVKKVINNTTYDMIILGLKSGIDYAFEMLQSSSHGIEGKKLILISTEKEQRLQLITNNHIDFITRPLQSKNIVDVVKKVKQQMFDEEAVYEIPEEKNISSKPLNLLAIPSIDEVKIIKIEDILYLQSEGKYTTFHTSTKDKTIVASINLGEYEKKLINNNFFRIHNSFLVNMDNIINVQKRDGVYVKMNNQDVVPVAKRKKDALFHFLGIK